jgi:hypothetical protein
MIPAPRNIGDGQGSRTASGSRSAAVERYANITTFSWHSTRTLARSHLRKGMLPRHFAVSDSHPKATTHVVSSGLDSVLRTRRGMQNSTGDLWTATRVSPTSIVSSSTRRAYPVPPQGEPDGDRNEQSSGAGEP